MFKAVLLLSAVAVALAARLPQPRIVGGQDTEIEERPYQAAVLFIGNLICGGVILTPKYVLTAASCTHTMLEWTLSVKAGSKYYDQGEERAVVAFHNNPYYNHQKRDGDIAILELESPFIFGKNLNAIPLVSEPPKAGQVGIISGFGYDDFVTGKLSDVLKSTDVAIVDEKECRASYDPYVIYTDNMICAGYPGVGGKDSCEYDAGGPLTVDGKLVGISSWGIRCGDPDFPGIYTNVANYVSWINGIISK